MAGVAAAPRRRRLRLPSPRGLLMLPPAAVIAAILIAPLVLVALYSVNLETNLIGVPTKFT